MPCVLSGVFSVLSQAVQAGFMPRTKVVHTDDKNKGQVFIQSANLLLLALCIVLALAFKTSSALAGAYGIAVTTTRAEVQAARCQHSNGNEVRGRSEHGAAFTATDTTRCRARFVFVFSGRTASKDVGGVDSGRACSATAYGAATSAYNDGRSSSGVQVV